MSVEARVSSGQARQQSATALARLEADGFIAQREQGQGYKTSRTWQRAMAKAAVRLYEAGDPGEDLRVPIALAMVQIYAASLDDETLALLIEAMLPIERAALGLAPR